jgi:hypothetical protein
LGPAAEFSEDGAKGIRIKVQGKRFKVQGTRGKRKQETETINLNAESWGLNPVFFFLLCLLCGLGER